MNYNRCKTCKFAKQVLEFTGKAYETYEEALDNVRENQVINFMTGSNKNNYCILELSNKLCCTNNESEKYANIVFENPTCILHTNKAKEKAQLDKEENNLNLKCSGQLNINSINI